MTQVITISNTVKAVFAADEATPKVVRDALAASTLRRRGHGFQNVITTSPQVARQILAFMAGHNNVDSVIEAMANRRNLVMEATKATGNANPQVARLRTPHALRLTPPPVSALVHAWRREGSGRQPGITWDKSKWLSAFPACTDTLGNLPDALDRPTIRAAAVRAASGPSEAVAAFVAIMAWGYGRRGFGRFRTNRILSNASASQHLAAAATTLAECGPMAAYARLGSDLRVRQLGPAFGTKFLYFCPQRPGDQSALILDSLVARWLARNAELALDAVPWNPIAYRTYLDTMHAWAAAEGVAPDELEECIFRAQAAVQGNQWA